MSFDKNEKNVCANLKLVLVWIIKAVFSDWIKSIFIHSIGVSYVYAWTCRLLYELWIGWHFGVQINMYCRRMIDILIALTELKWKRNYRKTTHKMKKREGNRDIVVYDNFCICKNNRPINSEQHASIKQYSKTLFQLMNPHKIYFSCILKTA